MCFVVLIVSPPPFLECQLQEFRNRVLFIAVTSAPRTVLGYMVSTNIHLLNDEGIVEFFFP